MNILSTTSDTTSLDCQGIYVNYLIHEYRTRTLKEAVINRLRRQNQGQYFQALKGVDVKVSRGECIALIGHNGSGKSTMLKIMAGIFPPSAGSVQRFGSCIPQIELGAGFDPELTGRENIFLCLGILGLTRREIESLIPPIAAFSELQSHMEMPIKTYSSGMYMRLGFACSVCVQADILLIDEILSVGDENFQKKCITKMREIRNSGSTMVLVTHDMNQVLQMANRVLVFDHGLKVHEGHPKEGIAFYHELMEQKRLASLSADVRNEEVRQRELKQNHGSDALGALVKLKLGSILPKDGSAFGLVAGDGCEIVIEFEALKEMDCNPCIGFAIQTHLGLRVLGGNSQMLPSLDQSIYRVPGRYKLTLAVGTLTLAAGNYRLIIAIHNENLTKTLDINGCAQEFTVVNRGGTKNFDADIIEFGTFVSSAEMHRAP